MYLCQYDTDKMGENIWSANIRLIKLEMKNFAQLRGCNPVVEMCKKKTYSAEQISLADTSQPSPMRER